MLRTPAGKHIYDQGAFRQLLAVERRRTASDRSVVLLLIGMRTAADLRARIDVVTAARLFDRLTGSLRDVDFVGWFRDSWIAGAVLTQGSTGQSQDAPDRAIARITDAIVEHVPVTAGHYLTIRVLRLRAQRKRP